MIILVNKSELADLQVILVTKLAGQIISFYTSILALFSFICQKIHYIG